MVTTVKFSEFAQGVLSNTTNTIAGVSSPSGGANIQIPFPLRWDTSGRPIAPVAGTLGYNTSLTQLEYWDGLSWQPLASGGSGTINIGAQNQVAYYPNNGTTIAGLTSANNAGLFTNGAGVPSMQVATGTGAPVRQIAPTFINPTLGSADATSLAFTSTDGIIGTLTNDNASIGAVGEYIESIVNVGSSISLSSAVATDITSFVLHQGDWDLWANVAFTALVPVSQYFGWISTVSATVPDLSKVSYFIMNNMSSFGFTVPGFRLSLPSPTTVYLSAYTTFIGSPGDVKACGGLYARVRR